MQVTQYKWGQDSAIQRMDVRKLESGNLEAYIHAPSNAGAGELADIPAKLAKKGFTSVADSIGGESLLRVSGFESADDLVQALGDSGCAKGECHSDVVGEKEHKAFADKVRKHTVKLSGVFGIIGHAALGAVGVMQGDMKRVATSAFYTTATLTSAVYGAGEDGGAGKVVDDMKDYLRDQGVAIPEGDKLTAEELSKKGGVIDTLHGYIKKHPLEIGNTIGLMGNVMLTYSGLKGGEKIEPARTAAGMASMLGALTVILVQEKDKKSQGQYAWPGIEDVPGIAATDLTPEQVEAQNAKQGKLSKLADFVQERPLRTAGALNLGGNLAMFADAHSMSKNANLDAQKISDKMAATTGEEHDSLMGDYDKQKMKAKATGALAYTTSATYLIATAFTSLSSKTKISDYNDKEMLGKLCAMSANLIAEQPAEVREEVIQKSARYLSKQPDVKEDQGQIVEMLNEKIDQLAQSPWAARVAVERSQMAHSSPSNNVGV